MKQDTGFGVAIEVINGEVFILNEWNQKEMYE